jgi:hypothetical protein
MYIITHFYMHVYFFCIADLITEPPRPAGCSFDGDCPDHAACEKRLCINPCAIRDPCAFGADCLVVNHRSVCTCPDGYIGSPTIDCRLRKYDQNVVKLHKLKYKTIS